MRLCACSEELFSVRNTLYFLWRASKPPEVPLQALQPCLSLVLLLWRGLHLPLRLFASAYTGPGFANGFSCLYSWDAVQISACVHACEVLKEEGRQLGMGVGCAHFKKRKKKLRETAGILNRLNPVFLFRWRSLVGLSKHYFSESFLVLSMSEFAMLSRHCPSKQVNAANASGESSGGALWW